MSDKFSKVPIASANRSLHDLSSPTITTTDFGRLDVVYHTQLVEGDDLKMNIASFLRAAPMVVPTIGRVYMNIRAFFVPNRILVNKATFDWDLWRNNLSNASHPYITAENLSKKFAGSSPALNANLVKDFRRHLSQLGFPEVLFNRQSVLDPTAEYNEKYSPFALLAYQRIWWDWYRDSNLIDDSQKGNYVNLADAGSNLLTNLRPCYCCYQKDFFTTGKVMPQEGFAARYPAVSVGSVTPYPLQSPNNPGNVVSSLLNELPVNQTLSSTPSNIQFLRAANSLQNYLERNNIAGGRVMARFYARFGVTPDSVRLDQSEYCGGYSMPLNIGDVTSPLEVGTAAPSTTPFIAQGGSFAGQLAGKAIIQGGQSNINYHAVEDGTFMIISSLVPEVFYYQGVPFDLLRGVSNVKEEYFTPEYENGGYEPIYHKELSSVDPSIDGPNASRDNDIFCFHPRYSRYKFKMGNVNGDMVLRETRTGMQSFHLARTFYSGNGFPDSPDLLPGFTMISPAERLQFDRIFAVPGNIAEFDHFEGAHYCSCKIVRPMSAANLPSLEPSKSGKVVTIDNGGVRM